MRRRSLVLSTATVLACLWFASAAFAAAPPASAPVLQAVTFESTNATDNLLVYDDYNPYGAPSGSMWGRVTYQHALTGNYGLWCAGTSAGWPNYPASTHGQAVLYIPDTTGYVESTIQYSYVEPSIGAVDALGGSPFVVGWINGSASPTSSIEAGSYWDPMLPPTSSWSTQTLVRGGLYKPPMSAGWLRFQFVSDSSQSSTGQGATIDDIIVTGYKYNAVKNLAAVRRTGAPSIVDVSWSAPYAPGTTTPDARPIGYRVWRHDLTSATWTEATVSRVVGSTSFVDSGAAATHVLEYVVLAYNTTGDVDWGKLATSAQIPAGQPVDTTPPNTIATPLPANAFSSWASSDVTVTLSATDASSSVAWTHYSLNGAAEQSGTVFVISVPGTTTVGYRSQDGLGNAETTHTQTVRVDKQAPSTSAPGILAKYYSGGGKTITLARSDSLSGVANTYWRIGGGSYAVGSSVTVPSVAGSYTLEYYSTDVAGNIEGVHSALFDVINTYTLHYVAGANGSIDGSATQVVDQGASGTLVTAVPSTGYHFVGWSDGYPTAARTDTNVIANKTPTATFAIDTYALKYTAGTGGTISGTASQTVPYNGSGMQVTAAPTTGYHFVSWSDGGLTAARTDSNVTAGHTYNATFAINTYALKYTAGTGGTISGATSQTVPYNGSGTQVTAVADAGYKFLKWSDNNTNATRTDPNITADATFVATFEYPVTLPPSNPASSSASLIGTATTAVTVTIAKTDTTPTPLPGVFTLPNGRFDVSYTGSIAAGSKWWLTLPYGDLDDATASAITVRHFTTGGVWVEIPKPYVFDFGNRTVSFETTSLSPFVLTVPDVVAATIDSVSPGTSTFGTSVRLVGHGHDSLGHAISSYEWSIDGAFHSSDDSCTISGLSAGTHTVSLLVKCAESDTWSAAASRTLVVNRAPTTVSGLSVSPSRLTHNKSNATFRGYVTAAGPSVTGAATMQISRKVTVTKRRKVKGHWKKYTVTSYKVYKTAYVVPGAGGIVSTTYKPKYSGTWKLTVTYPGSGNFNASSVASKTFSVK